MLKLRSGNGKRKHRHSVSMSTCEHTVRGQPFASYKTNTHHQLLLQHAETWLLPEITRGLLALRKQHNHQTTYSRHSQTAHSSRDTTVVIKQTTTTSKPNSSNQLLPIPTKSKPKTTSAEWGSQTLRQACYRENPESAMCVQNLNDSRGLAIRITYRISLRSSSLWEPRHPPLKVVLD